MTNQINVTDLGVYSEVSGSGINITDLGVYVESLESSNEIDITSLGSYVEVSADIIQIDSLGVYVEISEPVNFFAVFYSGFRFCNVYSIKFNTSVSKITTTVLNDVAGRSIPNIPDFSVQVDGFWCSVLAIFLDTLSNQENDSLSIIITDRYRNSFVISNTLSFVTSFKTDINIDNAIIYSVTFVGSGMLETQVYS